MTAFVRPVTLIPSQTSHTAVRFGTTSPTPSLPVPTPTSGSSGPRTVRLSTLGYIFGSLVLAVGTFFGGKYYQTSLTAPTPTTAVSATDPTPDPSTVITPVATTATSVVTGGLPVSGLPSGVSAPSNPVITDTGHTDTAGNPILPPAISSTYFDYSQPIRIPPGVESIAPFRPVLPDGK